MAISIKPALIILAWGNASRGDDCAGPVMAAKLAALNIPELELIEDIQLNVEHLLDLHIGVPVLFIDASSKITEGYKLERLLALADDSISTHSVSPPALLNLYQQTLKRSAPPAFLLHIYGHEFELGQAASSNTLLAIDLAWAFLSDLLKQPSKQWHDLLDTACQSGDTSSKPLGTSETHHA